MDTYATSSGGGVASTSMVHTDNLLARPGLHSLWKAAYSPYRPDGLQAPIPPPCVNMLFIFLAFCLVKSVGVVGTTSTAFVHPRWQRLDVLAVAKWKVGHTYLDHIMAGIWDDHALERPRPIGHRLADFSKMTVKYAFPKARIKVLKWPGSRFQSIGGRIP